MWKLLFLFAVFYASLMQAATYQCDVKGVPRFQQTSCASNYISKRRYVPLPEGESVRASELPEDLRSSYGLAKRYCNDCEDGLCTNCSAFTRLSEKAALLRSGMTKREVLTILGEPDWVILPADSGVWSIRHKKLVTLKFYWQNTTCNPIVAYIGESRKLIAWSTGRAQCFEKQRYTNLPPDHFRCNGRESQRRNICR